MSRDPSGTPRCFPRALGRAQPGTEATEIFDSWLPWLRGFWDVWGCPGGSLENWPGRPGECPQDNGGSPWTHQGLPGAPHGGPPMDALGGPRTPRYLPAIAWGPCVHHGLPKTCRHLPSICRPLFFLSFRRTWQLFTKPHLQKHYTKNKVFSLFLKLQLRFHFLIFAAFGRPRAPPGSPLESVRGSFGLPSPP